MLYETMKTVFILALIAAVCMCSEEDVSRVGTEEGRPLAPIAEMDMCSGDVSEMETEGDRHNPIVPQKLSDDEGNVNDSQNQEKEKQDLLNFSQGFVGEEGEAKLQEIMERFRDKESEVEFFRERVKQKKPLTPQERKSAKLLLCEIIPGVETNLDLKSVLERANRVTNFATRSSSSLFDQIPELREPINFICELRIRLLHGLWMLRH
jgi:hypothetical protein